MDITCSACHKSITIDRTQIVTPVTCPGCGKSVTIPNQHDGNQAPIVEAATDEPFLEVDNNAEERNTLSQPSPSRPPPRSLLKKTCPMCGAQVDLRTRACPDCGEPLPGVQEKDARFAEGIWREGNRLVMRTDARLPAICIKTNQPATDWIYKKVYWYSPWLYLLLLAAPFTCMLAGLVFLILALLSQKKIDLDIGLTRRIIVRRRWIIAGGWLGSLSGIGLIVAALSAALTEYSALTFGIVLLLGSLISSVSMSQIVVATKITKRHAWLKGFHPDFLAAFPAFPGEEPRE